jgi:hypothetical protein
MAVSASNSEVHYQDHILDNLNFCLAENMETFFCFSNYSLAQSMLKDKPYDSQQAFCYSLIAQCKNLKNILKLLIVRAYV